MTINLQLLLICLIALLNVALANADDAPEIDESWEVIYINGQRIGYVHSRGWQTGTGDDLRYWTEESSRLSIKRFGGNLSITTKQLTTEDADGHLLSFRHETDNPPISNVIVEGTVDGDKLQIKRTAAGRTTASTQPWDETVKAPAFVDRQLEADPIDAGETKSFRTFEPQYLKVAEVTLSGEPPKEAKLLDGTTQKLRRMLMTHSLIPGVEMTLYTDDDGNSVKTESPLMNMETYTVSQTEALKEIAGAELDLAVSTLVKVELIENAHQTKRVVYELTLDRPGMPVSISEGPTQSVKQLDDTRYRITVTAKRPDKNESSKTVDVAYLSCSRELECEHPSVIALADEAAGAMTDPIKLAIAMEKFVHRKLTSKNFSTAQATAAEVARTLEGDCTEHAVLLAAMLRVKGIPSRVAVGLVYAGSHQVFGGHMWTEAYLNGAWIPFDATLGRGGIGGGHIKFAESSLADDAPPMVTAFLPLIGLLEHMKLKVVETE